MKRILIVEDERDIQELLEAYLGDAGYETATAGDGIEAVSLFQQEAFDLVLLDVMLPKLDGFGVCELIRRQSRVPIVLLTALDGEAEQLRGFDLEIDDYITKPFSMPILLRKLAAVLRRAGGPVQPRAGVYPGNPAGQAVGLRLFRGRAGGGQPHQEPPQKAGGGLH